ncbi:MAG: GNAT family N-acetyltransferase [Micromonospora sp.]
MKNAGLLRTALTRWGVPGLSCRGATHTVRSTRLEVSVARVGDLVEFAELEDEEIRYRQGTSQRAVVGDLAAFPSNVPIWTRECGTFVARERSTGRLVANLSIYVESGRQLHVGGSVVAGARRQGYGREALQLVCALGHRHLGMRHLIARCEAGNVASCRWLTSAGFTRMPGDPRHVLPDGRAVETLWWQHADPLSRRRCRSPQAPGLHLHLA